MHTKIKNTILIAMIGFLICAPQPTEANIITSLLSNVIAPIGNVALELVGSIFPVARPVIGIVKHGITAVADFTGLVPEATNKYAKAAHKFAGFVKGRRDQIGEAPQEWQHPKDISKPHSGCKDNLKKRIGITEDELKALVHAYLDDVESEEESGTQAFEAALDRLGGGGGEF